MARIVADPLKKHALFSITTARIPLFRGPLTKAGYSSVYLKTAHPPLARPENQNRRTCPPKVNCQSVYLGLVFYAAAVFGFTRTRAQLQAGAVYQEGNLPEKVIDHLMYTSPIDVVAAGVGP